MSRTFRKTRFISLAILAIACVLLAQGLVPGRALAAEDEPLAATPLLDAQASSARARLSDYAYYPVREFKYLNRSKTSGIGVTGSLGAYGDIYNWCVWNVTPDAIEPVYSVDMAARGCPIIKNGTKLYSVTGGKIFTIESSAHGSSTWSYALFASDEGEVRKIPDIGGMMKRSGEDEFSVVREAFDHVKSRGIWTGHTYNAYYYRWDGKKLVEIGAKAMSKKRFLRAKNAQRILDAIARSVRKSHGTRASFDQFAYRGNGIVSVNYSYRDGHGGTYRENVKLRLSSGSLRYVKAWSPYRHRANALAKATGGGWLKLRGGSLSKRVGVAWTKSLPAAFKA